MAKLLKLRRGTTTQHVSFTGAEGEVTIDTTKDTAVVHDGSQAGGRPLAREDMSNVSSASIAGQLGVDSIATTKIAGGALPTDVTVASANLVDGTIVNADIASNAGIAGTKLENSGVTAGQYGSSSAIPIVTVDAQGLVTAASTTAIDSTTIANGTSSVAVANNGNITTTRAGTARHVVDDAGVHITGTLDVSGQTTLNGDLTIGGTYPSINLYDSNNNPDYRVQNTDGMFAIYDQTNGANRIQINTDGHIDLLANVDIGNGLDVTGNITATGTLSSGNITISNDAPSLYFTEGDANPDYQLLVNGGQFRVYDVTNTANRLVVNTDGHVDVAGNLDVGAGVDVTGNITVSGTVDGRDVAADGTKLDSIQSGATDDQTGAEIASALNGQNVYTTGNIGRDSNDHIVFTDDSRLDVVIAGNNEFRFEADGDFHADGDVYAFSTTTASDENLKKDITIVSDAVSKVEALKGVTFKWKENDGESAGVIAQDVEKVLPEVVKTVNNPDGNTYKAVNYAGINSILIEAIKELSARIKVLEAK